MTLGAGARPIRDVMLPQAAPKAQALARDFEAAGVPLSAPVIGQGRAAGLVAQAARTLPGSPVTSGLQQGMQAVEGGVERVAAGFGEATPENAGNIARNALRTFAADKSSGNRHYSEFFRLMHGAPPAPVQNTINLLRELRGRFPSAPELTGLFTNPKLSRVLEAIEPRTQTIPARTSSVLGPGGEPIVTAPARTVQRGGVLSMPELKELRTQIGYLLEEPHFGPEAIPKAQLRRVYAALSRDMQGAARTQGPAASQALSRATFDYGARQKALERLEPLIRPNAAENTYAQLNAAAGTTRGADVGLLQTVKNSITPEEWSDIGAATIRKLGMPTPGARDILESNFSVTSFSTNWNKLSGKAKDLLFGVDTPGSRRSGLETLSRVAQAYKNVGKLANVSHSGEIRNLWSAVEGVGAAVAAGYFPWAVGLGLTGAYGMSKIMMSPGFTRWLYQLPKTIQTAPTREAMIAQAGRSLQLFLTNPEMANRPLPRQTPQPERRRTGQAGPMGGTVSGAERAPASP